MKAQSMLQHARSLLPLSRVCATPTQTRRYLLTLSAVDSSTAGDKAVMTHGQPAGQGLNWLLQPSNKIKFCFVGGKGGVGKTSTSAAVAIKLSDTGFRTLVVSTDPAHSLGDALGLSLSPGVVTPIATDPNLSALEIDVEAAMASFREMSRDLDVASLSASLGLPAELLQSLGLGDLGQLLSDPPPGIDEILALQSIFKLSREVDSTSDKPRFDRIVIDTAPTGHTLRLLQLPDFLTAFAGKALAFRSRVQGAVRTVQNMFSGGVNSAAASKLDAVWVKMEELRSYMTELKATLRDKEQTRFVVVAIPTSLAVAESRRLVSSLRGKSQSQSGGSPSLPQTVCVAALVCNQLLSEAAGPRYVGTRRAAQRRCVDNLKRSSQHLGPSLAISEVGYVDTEVVGVPGLRYFAQLAHRTSPSQDSRMLTIFGGKGGVGKTTSAASYAVSLSDAGYRTLLVSSDPAHSLGDALLLSESELSGSPRLLADGGGPGLGGELWVMEIDPNAALLEFKSQLTATVSSSSDVTGSQSQSQGIIGELAGLLDDPPPGIDEVAALSKIMGYLSPDLDTDTDIDIDCSVTKLSPVKAKFDRVVLDTAPTGHTLRMLQMPPIVVELLDRVKTVSQRVSAVSAMGTTMGAMGGVLDGLLGGSGTFTGTSSASSSMSTPSSSSRVASIERYQQRMRHLDELLHDPARCEFAVVTVPTELATAETSRLLTALTAEGVPTRRVIINQMLPDHSSNSKSDTSNSESDNNSGDSESDKLVNAYLTRLRSGQSRALADLVALASQEGVPLYQVPYFDMEVRTVYGLRAISHVLFPT